MLRLTRDEWAIELALLTAERSTCCRRAVGCVLLNEKGHVIATGYNGVARGQPHCNEAVVRGDRDVKERYGVDMPKDVEVWHPYACRGATAPSGVSLDACQAIHAEQNALLQCKDVSEIYAAYVTVSPCITCVKLLLNTGCRRIVFVEEYPHNQAKDLWISSGREWLDINQL